MTGFVLLGGILLTILSAFYLKQIPGKGDIEILKKDLHAQFEAFLEPDQPMEIKLVPPPRKGQQMSIRIRCVLRAKLPVKNQNAHRSVLQEMGQQTLNHPEWLGKVAFASVENQAEPKHVEKVLRRPVERSPMGTRRADRKPAKG